MAEGEVLVILEVVSVKNPEKFQTYQSAVRLQIGERGATAIARGGSHFEGSPTFGPTVVQKWPSASAFYDWQASEDYRPYRDIRHEAADIRIAVIPLM